MLSEMKKRVYEANMSLWKMGLIVLTWGNVSEIDREKGYIAIKPSGVPYESMTADDIVIVDLDGNVIEGNLRPSSDLPTHIELYKSFKNIGGVCHTHSRWATVFSQAMLPVPPLGTTHADAFYGAVPITRKLTSEEISGEYEKETGKVIIEAFENTDPMAIPAALVASHGPFTWGKNAAKAVENAVILEEVAMMAWHTMSISSGARIQKELLDKHYLRKHGKNAYYGQAEIKS